MAKKFHTVVYKYDIFDSVVIATSKEMTGKELKLNCFGMFVDAYD
jgi:hypothetical protein